MNISNQAKETEIGFSKNRLSIPIPSPETPLAEIRQLKKYWPYSDWLPSRGE